MDPAGEEKIKAVIALPPVRDFYFTPSRASALGAEAVGKTLAHLGIDAEIVNFPAVAVKPEKQPVPEELTHLQPYLIPNESGPLSFFRAFRRFGPDELECARTIIDRCPDLVLISCFAWAYAAEAVALAAAVRQSAPNVLIAAGGAGVSVNPLYFRKAGLFDAVLEGPAESSLPPFVAEYLGIRRSGDVPAEPDFLWSETGVSAGKRLRFLSAILSRGCPKACRFCANHLVHGRRFRKVPVDRVEAGVKALPRDLNISMNFEDDNLTFDMAYFSEVITIVRSVFPDAKFTAENGLDYTFLNPELIETLAGWGFRAFNLSMASSSSRLLENENRPADTDRLRAVVEAAAAAGVSSTTYFICGLENDSVDTVLDSLLTLHRLPTLTGISMFYPVPGLPGFPPETMNRFHPRLAAGSSARPWTGSLSTPRLLTAFRLARLSNLIKTHEGRIASGGRAPTAAATADGLISAVKCSGRLKTLSGGEIIDVPGQDEDMVRKFLELLRDR